MQEGVIKLSSMGFGQPDEIQSRLEECRTLGTELGLTFLTPHRLKHSSSLWRINVGGALIFLLIMLVNMLVHPRQPAAIPQY